MTTLISLAIVYLTVHVLVAGAALWAGVGAQERLKARHEGMIRSE